MPYAISYDYPGTVNGRPVGRVYVLRVYPKNDTVFSYKKHALEATLWPTEEAAAALAATKHWPNWKVESV